MSLPVLVFIGILIHVSASTAAAYPKPRRHGLSNTTTCRASCAYPRILQLPVETTEFIVVFCNAPSTLAALAQTCQHFRTLLYVLGDNNLWRRLYLLPLDDPQGSRRLKLDSDNFDWGCGLAQLAKMILSVLGGSGGLGDIYCTRSCGVGRIPSCDFGGLPRSSSSCGILPSPQDWSI